MEEIKCKFCQKSFLPNRLGMIFCRSKCRDDYKNRKRAFEKRLVEKDKKLERLEAELISAKQSKEDYSNEKANFDKETDKILKEESTVKRIFKQLDRLSKEQRYEKLWKNDLRKLEPSLEKTNLEILYRVAHQGIIEERLKEYEKYKEDIISHYKRLLIQRLLKYPLFNMDPKLKEITDEIELLEQQISDLEKEKVSMNIPAAKNKMFTKGRISKPVFNDYEQSSSTMKKYTAGEVIKMEFKTFTFESELGAFLGRLDRNMLAFALTGDAGAGKSYFSYQLTRLFVDNDYRVAYFSLEEGLGQITKDKFIQYGIETKVDLITGATYDEVDQEAENYDVIVIDSFSKLKRKASDYDLLRQRHPKTIFVVIFQKTTGKTIRGGSAITFDSSAIINVTVVKDENNIVQERLAKMKKSRYGTMGWIYSITNEKIVLRG